MNLKQIRANTTEIETKEMRLLISYKTPVACWISGKHYKTCARWSKTTTRHINDWFEGYAETAQLKDQEYFNYLLNEVK